MSAPVGIPITKDDSVMDLSTNGLANMITGFPLAIISTEHEILYEDGVKGEFDQDVHDFK